MKEGSDDAWLSTHFVQIRQSKTLGKPNDTWLLVYYFFQIDTIVSQLYLPYELKFSVDTVLGLDFYYNLEFRKKESCEICRKEVYPLVTCNYCCREVCDECLGQQLEKDVDRRCSDCWKETVNAHIGY